ncbi:glycosyltransferase [Microbacterium sp.]|uniref:glycosyltransferase n=1 Tax=Microbacterium sp. TaxID=51671 RepID=UPI0028A83D7D|nr:glycosyltransferase [Microbacterium sp.]
MSGILVHEWLARTGGSENVFEALGAVFPDAERFALWNDSAGRFTGVRETWLARTPLRRSKALALPLMPFAWRRLPAAQADWILASSHLFAHHARFGGQAAGAPKLVYAHTPARYIWAPGLDGRGDSLPARAVSSALKPLDRRRAQEPVAIAANSAFVAQRIRTAWERDAEIIHPPVAVEQFAREPELSETERLVLDDLPDGFLFAVSRWVAYKRLDAAIAAGRASGRPVVLAGEGPDEARLRALAQSSGVHVRFVHHPSSSLLKALYRRAAALVFAPIEDFGIVPVESMASGTPVLANAVGGAAESVIDGVTGALVHEWDSPRELASAVDRALSTESAACVARAADFRTDVFQERIGAFVRSHV